MLGWLQRDGVALFYEEAGGEGVPFLLVHGIACDHTHLAPQFELSGRAGHRVVAVDLRGHGRSGAPEDDYTIEGFADDLAWTCGQLGLEKPVVVGHSLGGEVSLALAAAFPDLPSAVVLMDSTIVPPPERAAFVYDTAAAAACKVPVLYIDAGTPNTNLERFGELCPSATHGRQDRRVRSFHPVGGSGSGESHDRTLPQSLGSRTAMIHVRCRLSGREIGPEGSSITSTR